MEYGRESSSILEVVIIDCRVPEGGLLLEFGGETQSLQINVCFFRFFWPHRIVL
jgi:hypothetical protein